MARKRMEIDQTKGTADELLELSKKSKNPLEVKRYIALRMLMTRCSREDVMSFFGITWSTLQKWVRLWNKGGAESLKVGKPIGRPSRLTEEVKDFIVKKIEFTNPKTGERITGTAISGQLKKKIRDKLQQKLGLSNSSQDGVSEDKTKEDSHKKG
ncbi:MAG: helix-turn-helix domain-containing protein [Candidatus Eremiobacteraeota bacterium]|nr:helix-turn-helix domain-containing protein [Candidatus Eremiobacteraeota bacterium]